MAKLSTPHHRCEVVFAVTPSGVVPHCPYAAYRRDASGAWKCRGHLHTGEARRMREARAMRYGYQPGQQNNPEGYA